MTFLEWSDDYATGIASIDGEHQTLFMMVNALHQAVTGGGADADLPDLFQRLSAYVETHFEREEALMAMAGYPGLEEHKEEHRALRESLQFLIVRYDDVSGEVAANDVLRFLKNWLSCHVLASDMAYVPHLKDAG